MTNEFQNRQNVAITKITGQDLFCRAARRSSRDSQPALTEFELKLLAKEFSEITDGNAEPDDGAIVAEAFSNHSGATMAVVREIISDTLKINAYSNQLGVGFVGKEYPIPILSLHTSPHIGIIGSVAPVTFTDSFMPLGDMPETDGKPEIPYTPSPVKIVGKTPAGTLMVESIRKTLEQYAAKIGGFVCEEPLGIENLASFMVVRLVETKFGYCAQRLEVTFALDVAELVSTDPQAASITPFVKKD